MLDLVLDMHDALQKFCDAQDEHGKNCPLWTSKDSECELRIIERNMRLLGIEVKECTYTHVKKVKETKNERN